MSSTCVPVHHDLLTSDYQLRASRPPRALDEDLPEPVLPSVPEEAEMGDMFFCTPQDEDSAMPDKAPRTSGTQQFEYSQQAGGPSIPQPNSTLIATFTCMNTGQVHNVLEADLNHDGEYVIGRQAAMNVVQLGVVDIKVSSKHCVVKYLHDSRQFLVRDCSSNGEDPSPLTHLLLGTYVNDVQLPRNSVTVLRSGDRLQLILPNSMRHTEAVQRQLANNPDYVSSTRT